MKPPPQPLCPVNCLRIGAAHLALLAGFWVGVSPAALLACAAAFYLRLFAVTAIMHRYYGHGAFDLPRPLRFALTALACSAGQKGPLTWASSHRAHHAKADRDGDPHSPVTGGLFHAHIGWLLRRDALVRDPELIRQWRHAPEILWLDRWHFLPQLAFLATLAWLGSLGVCASTPLQMLYWGGLVSTLLVVHATCLVNSCGHRFGRRHPANPDSSRDLPGWLALFCLGDQIHAQHHHQPRRLRNGPCDPTAAVIELLARLGLVRGIQK